MAIPPPINHDTQEACKVKNQISAGTLHKRTFQVQLQGQFLSALETYARKRGLTPNTAFRELLEFRLVETGDLPDWWLERTRPRKL